MSEIASSIGALHEDALPEIKQILSRHRRELNIREAGVGGMSWSFGYYPAASSQLIPVPGSPVRGYGEAPSTLLTAAVS